MTLIVLAAVGCATAGPPVPPDAGSTTSASAPPAPSATETAWAAAVCGIDRALVEASRAPDRVGSGWREEPGAHRAEIVAVLTDVDTTLKSLQQQVAALTPAPFAGGDAVVRAYRDTIDPLQARIAGYASDAAVFPPDGIAAVFRLAAGELVSFTVGAPDLDDPAYARARRVATGCGGR
ncbi:hypothetical protein LZG04_28810 [Saccharothrix sp. S26]|nr:hypothetical protein [Saccharothrix sp. S26]